MMYRQTLTLEREIDIPFADLKNNISKTITCIPRVQSIETRPDGSSKIKLDPIQATPFITVRACGWINLSTEENCILWKPKNCPESNGCISGKATPINDGVKTKIVSRIDIFESRLPSLAISGRYIIGRYVINWADTLLNEFVSNWKS